MSDEPTTQNEQPQPNPEGVKAAEAASPADASPAGDRQTQAEPEDLFDLLGPSGKQHKKPKPKQPPSPQTGKADKEKAKEKAKDKAKAEPKKPETFPADAFVSYAGHQMPLPRDGMTEDEVYAWLGETYPELSKERADLLYDEGQKLIAPVMRGHRKGASAHSGAPLTVLREPPERGSYPPLFHVLGADGVYEVRKTQAGTFIARVPATMTPQEGFYPRVPKIPAALLAEAVDLFRKTPEREVLANVVYDAGAIGDPHGGSYTLHVPAQEGAPASVTADAFAETDRIFTVCQIHTHGSFRPFFSATDDEDELRSGLYGCVGRLGDPLPQSCWRYSCGGIYRPISPTRLFAESYPGELAKIVSYR